jgi:hypothetical protein
MDVRFIQAVLIAALASCVALPALAALAEAVPHPSKAGSR